ncbi:MAG TPA: LysE family translocator, partial [Kiloniellales bacterium]|nr:LysE family translocator [Kiloniellales bacterium]
SVLTWVGAAYLVYLAIKSWREDTSVEALQNRKAASLTRIWIEGALVNLLNPKVALFILAFLPQFTEPERGHVWAQILVLGTLFNIGGTIVNAAVALAAGSLAEHLRRRPSIKRWMNRICATLLGALAVRLATSARQG